MPVALVSRSSFMENAFPPLSASRQNQRGQNSTGRAYKQKRNSMAARDSYNARPKPTLGVAAVSTLSETGIERLKEFLSESYEIHAKQPGFPVLVIHPEELLRFVLSRVAMASAEQDPVVEIHGGVASCVLDSSEPRLLHRRKGKRGPTDFDARFVVTNDAVAFDSCRNMVEEFLFLKLSTVIGEIYRGPALRFIYFMKHAMIGDSLSVMSIGNPQTGKNIDVEFVYATDRPRLYFDDSNSCIIPLHLCSFGSSNFQVASLCGDFQRMVSLRAANLLQVPKFTEISNGLPLYIHTTLDKGFLAPEREDGLLCSHFCSSFVSECMQLMSLGRDQTSLLQSFMRSHYPTQPTACLAMVVSVVVNLLVHCGESELSLLRPNMTTLMCRYLAEITDALDEKSDSDACAEILSTLFICHYLARPSLPVSEAPATQGKGKAAEKSSDASVVGSEENISARLFELPETSTRGPIYLHRRTTPPHNAESAASIISDIAKASDQWSGAVKCIPVKLRCLLVAVAAALACNRVDTFGVTSFALLAMVRALVNEGLAEDAYSWVFEGLLSEHMNKDDRAEAMAMIDTALEDAVNNGDESGHRKRRHSASNSHRHKPTLPPPPAFALPRQKGKALPTSAFLIGRPTGVTSFLFGAMGLRSAGSRRRGFQF